MPRDSLVSSHNYGFVSKVRLCCKSRFFRLAYETSLSSFETAKEPFSAMSIYQAETFTLLERKSYK